METIEQITDRNKSEVHLLVNFNALPYKFYEDCPMAHRFDINDCKYLKKGLEDGTIVSSLHTFQDGLFAVVRKELVRFEEELAYFKENETFRPGLKLSHRRDVNYTTVSAHYDMLNEMVEALESNVSLFPIITAEIEKSLDSMIEHPEVFELSKPIGYSGFVTLKGDTVIYPMLTEVMYDPDYVKYLSRMILKKFLQNYILAYPLRKDDMVHKQSLIVTLDDIQVAMNSDLSVVTEVFCPYFFETENEESMFNMNIDIRMKDDHLECDIYGMRFIDIPFDLKEVFQIQCEVTECSEPKRISKHADWFKEYEDVIGLLLHLGLYGYSKFDHVKIENVLYDLRNYVTIVMKSGAPVQKSSFAHLIRKVFDVDEARRYMPDEDSIEFVSELLDIMASFPDNIEELKYSFADDCEKMVEAISRYV